MVWQGGGVRSIPAVAIVGRAVYLLVDSGVQMNPHFIDIIRSILSRHHVSRAGLFGSCARDEASSESDVDILVEIRPEASILDFVGLKLELEDALKQNVDLVEYSTVKSLLRERILAEEVPIL